MGCDVHRYQELLSENFSWVDGTHAVLGRGHVRLHSAVVDDFDFKGVPIKKCDSWFAAA
jgi:hypothetical protein